MTARPVRASARPPVQATADTRQVRYGKGHVHRLKERTETPGGIRYTARCARVLYGQHGAMLTTHDVNCPDCREA